MKRLLFVTTLEHVSWGGSEVLWSETAMRIAQTANNHEVHCLLKRWEPVPPHEERLINNGVRVHYLEAAAESTILQRGRERVFKLMGKPAEKRNHFMELLNSIKPNLVVFSHPNNRNGLNWMETCSAVEIPYINIFQLSTEVHWGDDKFMDKYILALDRAKTNYFVSEHNMQLTERMYGVRLTNGKCLYNPYNVSGEYIPYPNDSKGHYRLACPANFYALHKGQDLVLEVIADPYWKSEPLDVYFYGRGIHEGWLRRSVKKYGLENVFVEPFETNIEKVWSVNHALIMASRMEGMSLSLIEAMVCGRMPIVTNVGGVEELVKDGINGFIARCPSVESIYETLSRAWQQRDQWAEMGMKARASMKSNYSDDPVDDFMQKIENAL